MGAMPRRKVKFMPYETVQFPRTDDSSGTEITVHWAKDAHVQLHAVRHQWAGSPLSPNAQAASESISNPESTAPEPLPDEVWSETLTRDEINKLIRVLRRARDAVFGSDA
jgi:hypothetical protein